MTDYIIRAEAAATSLKSDGEVISDSLLVAMVLKGLPGEFKTFCTVVTQKEKQMIFSEFKVALRNFEENEKCLKPNNEDTLMRASSVQCYSCGEQGHMSF